MRMFTEQNSSDVNVIHDINNALKYKNNWFHNKFGKSADILLGTT